MRGFDLLDKMGLIAPAYVEAAEAQPRLRSPVLSRIHI